MLKVCSSSPHSEDTIAGTFHRVHYYLYYVLDVLERRTAVHVELDEPDGVTASRAKLTNEQLRIVNHKFESGHTVKVIALAGNNIVSKLHSHEFLS